MILAMALMDMVGVASIMPFMAVLSDPEIIQRNEYLAMAFSNLGFHRHEDFLFFLGIVVFATLLTSIGIKGLTTWLMLRFTHMRSYTLARRVISAYLGQPYEWYLNRNSAELSKTILAEVNQVVNGSLMPLLQLIAHGAVVFAILSLLIVANPQVALTSVLVLGILYGSIYGVLRRRLTRLGSMRNMANSVRFKTLSEAFSSIKDVKLGGYERVFLNKYDDQAKIFASAQSSAAIAGQLPKYALEAIAFGGVVAVCLFLMRSARGPEEALPMLALYALAGYRMMPALQHTYAQLALLRFSETALDALCEDLSAVENTRTTASGRGELTLRQSIEFDRVCYRYPGSSRKILDEISLGIPARSTVGLVGSTGSGKTTTVDILLGLLTPATGKLLIDGVALSPLNLRTWQSMIGYVPQHIYLTDDTVAANIAFGVDSLGEIDSDALTRVAKAARIYEFIVNELPEGFNTKIGERGVRLSGGQKQRLGIARALFRKPKVLILDEATSALDSVTERSVMDEIYALSNELTIVIIAHRLSTVKRCDRIFLLNSGQCVAQGSYDELLQTNPDFQLMVYANDTDAKPQGNAI